MDAAGARALAERIASGKPSTPEDSGDDRRPDGRSVRTPSGRTVEILYLKPQPAPKRELRIYVRTREGGLERRES